MASSPGDLKARQATSEIISDVKLLRTRMEAIDHLQSCSFFGQDCAEGLQHSSQFDLCANSSAF